jgi:hypothetical protein
MAGHSAALICVNGRPFYSVDLCKWPAILDRNSNSRKWPATKSHFEMTQPVDEVKQEGQETKPEEEVGKTESEAKSESQGDTSEKYSVKKSLGEGPFSRVEMWVEKGTGDVVVAKTITKEVDAEKFVEGARALLGLDHPSLLKTLGFVPQTASSHAALLTTQAPLGTLADVLKPGVKVGSTQRAAIVVGVAQALKHLHEKGLVHGQVKPSNIALDENGYPQLICHAAMFTRKQPGSAEPTDPATAWCSPEYLNGGEVTAASDVYALGLLAYQLITEKPVFDPALKHWLLLQAIMSGARPELPPLPAEIASVLVRSWDVDPAVRPTAAEFFEALSKANFAIGEDVDALSVRKYVSKFVEGAQPGESESAAESRANLQTREEVVKLRAEVGELTGKLKVAQLTTADLGGRLEKVVSLLTDRLEVLEERVSGILRAGQSRPPAPRVADAE